MKYSEEFTEELSEKCHEDLLEIGRRAETMSRLSPNTEFGNQENVAINAILRKDPYAADREKTEMRRDFQGELAVQPK